MLPFIFFDCMTNSEKMPNSKASMPDPINWARPMVPWGLADATCKDTPRLRTSVIHETAFPSPPAMVARRLPSTSRNWGLRPAPSMAWHALGAFGAWLQEALFPTEEPVCSEIKIWFSRLTWRNSKLILSTGKVWLWRFKAEVGQGQGLILTSRSAFA